MEILPNHDRSHDIWNIGKQPLDYIFSPRTVAIVGASEKLGSVGRTILWNLISNPFGGTVFPVNPHRHSVLGIMAYPNIKSIPDPIDLVIIATPAPSVPAIIDECIEVGVKGAIVISAGFKEIGSAGIELEKQIYNKIRGKMRLIGPNCLGLMNPHTGLNATFANVMARTGNVGFISQSGALCTSILDWSFKENVGFSAFISIGSMLDVDWGDLIYYLGDDPHTQSIVIYMESIGNARSFLSAAREVALNKPIIVIKAGSTEQAAKAAASHTGALAGSDKVLDAAFRRCGVLRVNRISDLFNTAELLAKQPRPKGSKLTIVTNAGGPAVLATDALILTGGELAPLSPETTEKLNQILPPHWSHNNPIDILGDADPQRYQKTIEIVANDPNSDGLLVILTPQAMTNPSQTAEQLKLYAKIPDKPILASWMGGTDIATGEMILNRASIPTYTYPDTAARMFNYMWKYSYNLRGIYQTPVLTDEDDDDIIDREKVAEIINKIRSEDRTILTELESKEVLAAYGIPIVKTLVAYSEEEAVKYADQFGYPVVLKLFSQTITHKTDVGGVQLNLIDAESVIRAYRAIKKSVLEKVGDEHFLGVSVQPMIRIHGYEIILGSSLDPQFGPVILFGSGGQLVEVFQDTAIALPPLNTTIARRLMEQTQIYKALQGVRGRQSVDLETLEKIMVRFSQLVVEQPWIKEIDINPLLTSAESLIAVDARIVLHPTYSSPEQLPKLAIKPYPRQYIGSWQLKNGVDVTIRPIRAEDEPLMVEFHQHLSEQSVYFRYFHLMKLSQRTTHDRLTRLCFIDYEREIALVAEHDDPETDQRQILAVGRLIKLHGRDEAEFSMVVRDKFHNQGLGTELLKRLVQIGKDEKLSVIGAEILRDNGAMQRVSEKVGFLLSKTEDHTIMKAELALDQPMSGIIASEPIREESNSNFNYLI
jgi:acetyltransferase